MKTLLQALYTLFNADTNFKTAVGSQFYPGSADQESASYPYAVYYLITDTSDWTFAEDIEVFTVQISVFDNSNSPGTILDIYEYLKALFDDATLTISGYDLIRMHRENMQLIRDDQFGTWHLVVDYEIEVQRERT